MIEALVSGKLHGQATQKTARSGNPFTTAKVRVPAGDEAIFCNVIAFDDSAQAALLALGGGDAVALAGTLKPGVWVDRQGQARPSLDMTAAQVLTVYHLKRRRAAVAQDDDSASPQPEVKPKFKHPNFQQPELHDDDVPPWDSLDGI